MRAKHRYFNSFTSGSFSNYDEKVLSIMTLYGLPMLRVQLPITTTTPPEGEPPVAASRATPNGVQITSYTLNFDSYEANFVRDEDNNFDLGTYYTITGEDDVHIAGARPIQPRTSRNVWLDGTLARGAVMVGGSFTDLPEVDPVISRVITDDVYAKTEPAYEVNSWYPTQLGTINRFLGIDGKSRERLVVTPGQFKPTLPGGNKQGTQRLYNSLEFEVYHAPYGDADFTPPTIWQVEAVTSTDTITFRVMVEDDSGDVERVVVLYRAATSNTWSKVEPVYDQASGYAEGSVPQVNGAFYYFVQAVDPSGNVAVALSHGNPYRKMQPFSGGTTLYLPLIQK